MSKKKSFMEKRMAMKSENEQLRYLSQSIKLEEAVNPHIIGTTMLMISIAVLTFIVWASFTYVNEITKAKGEVVPQGFSQVVQHLDGGMVTEIHTSEGDLVKEGQILLRIDDGGAYHDLAEARTKQRFLKIEAERLRAFIDGREPDFKQFSGDRNRTDALKQDGKDEISDDVEIRKMHDRAEKLKESYRIAKQGLTLQKKLFSQGNASKITLLQYKKEVSQIESQAHKELGDIDAQIAQNQEIINKLERRVKRLEVRSPVFGLVKGFEVNTIGSIVAPGRTLAEIVPLDRNLVVDVRISPQDIGHVSVGKDVRVKISSYDFSRYGAVDGTLEFVSATTFLDEKKIPYYRGRVVLSQNYVGKNPETNVILPGMTADIDIVTGKKTILAYLLKPIHLSIKTAFTER